MRQLPVNQPAPPVAFEPALVEEAVLRAVAGRCEEARFWRERDRLYELSPGEEREAEFFRLHSEWFAHLALGAPIGAALGELPILAAACVRVLVRRAITQREEGADLLVPTDPENDDGQSALIRLRAVSFAEPDALLAFLRGELLHVADMVDPDFGYEPELPETDGGPTYVELIRTRYRALWSTTVAGRLVRRGVWGTEAASRARREFAASFAMLGPGAGEAFERFFSLESPAHAGLVAFALAPRGTAGEEGLVAGGRCPLCRFPTHAPEPESGRLPAELVARIRADFPDWSPAAGLCRQCADLYRASVMSRTEAATLPR